MTADQTPTYRPTAITQRDGSALQNSNCRMAAISTGLDYHTKGAKKSTGAQMREHQDDQSGGTGSDDAAQAWSRGYSQTLVIRDGQTFDDAIADLRDGRIVHLDVWHATVGGPCLSGSGAYGHTITVLPDCLEGAWLVADPWCKPPTWARVAESKLRAGAEEWGRRVSSEAHDFAPMGATASDVNAQLSRAAKALMQRFRPGRPDPSPDPMGFAPDTGGGIVLYTVTAPGDLQGGRDMAIVYSPERWALEAGTPFYDAPGGTKIGQLSKNYTVTTLGAPMDDSEDKMDWSWRLMAIVTGAVTGTSESKLVWIARPPGDPIAVEGRQKWEDATWAHLGNPEWVPADGGQSIEERDAEWRAWLLAGSPGEDT